MNRITAGIAALFLMAGSAWAELGPLVTPQELSATLASDAPVILDIRPPAAAEGIDAAETFAAGRIPGAINAP